MRGAAFLHTKLTDDYLLLRASHTALPIWKVVVDLYRSLLCIAPTRRPTHPTETQHALPTGRDEAKDTRRAIPEPVATRLRALSRAGSLAHQEAQAFGQSRPC